MADDKSKTLEELKGELVVQAQIYCKTMIGKERTFLTEVKSTMLALELHEAGIKMTDL